MSMGRRIAGVFAGLVAGVLVIFGVERISNKLYSPPAGLDVKDTEALKRFIDALPVEAFLLVVLAYVLGSFAGGLCATLVSGRGGLAPAMVVGALLMIAGFVNLASLPHPLWFAVVSTAVYLPCAWAGAFLGMSGSGRAPLAERG